ncbi:MAG: GPR endopeptidase [Firmicutes bacterium]|nr:GPR endopeptidase [Bacillota bacterium]
MELKTGLVIEAHEVLLQTSQLPEIEGIDTRHFREGDVDISVIEILSDAAAEKIGKAKGKYVTLEAPGMRDKNSQLEEHLLGILNTQLQDIVPLSEDTSVLVVGLGNWNVTPDSLGPSVVENLYVTRHLKSLYPDKLGPGFRNLCAIAPGVLGITGIETSEIIYGIVQRVKPDVVVAIDALAARSLHRLNTTIQISDTGIYPGSGVGNRRQGLTKDTLGVPVIAVGVPTVVDAATMTNDVIDLLIQAMRDEAAELSSNTENILKILDDFATEDKHKMIREVLDPTIGLLMVTPKEVDRLLEDISSLLANALNVALHPRVAREYLN